MNKIKESFGMAVVALATVALTVGYFATPSVTVEPLCNDGIQMKYHIVNNTGEPIKLEWFLLTELDSYNDIIIVRDGEWEWTTFRGFDAKEFTVFHNDRLLTDELPPVSCD